MSFSAQEVFRILHKGKEDGLLYVAFYRHRELDDLVAAALRCERYDVALVGTDVYVVSTSQRLEYRFADNQRTAK